MTEDVPLYNSRIVQNYVRLIQKRYPQVDVAEVLRFAEMELFQVEDVGHWFSQKQINRFHARLKDFTGNRDIAREAGAFSSSPESINEIGRYFLGCVGVSRAYALAGKVANRVSRASFYESKVVGKNSVEIQVTPRPGVCEEPFQCENRLGYIESIARLFGVRSPKIEHEQCVFRGADSCRYRVTWKYSRAMRWGQIQKMTAPLFVAAGGGALLFSSNWLEGIEVFWACLGLFGLVGWRTSYWKSQESLAAVRQLEANAGELFEQVEANNRNAILVREIGELIVQGADAETLLAGLGKVLADGLPGKRGLILLANTDGTWLGLAASFGLDNLAAKCLRENKGLVLSDQRARDVFCSAFFGKKSIHVSNVESNSKGFLPENFEILKTLGFKTMICSPIVCRGVSLGLLVVDNAFGGRPFLERDVNLYSGIAPQIGIALDKERLARYSDRLELLVMERVEDVRRSEQKYRQLFEKSSEGVAILDCSGAILEANRLFTDLVMSGKSSVAGVNPGMLTSGQIRSVMSGESLVVETTRTQEGGSEIEAESSFSVIEIGGRPFIQSFHRDVTERKRLEDRLRQAQKMESIGQLAGGVAHDFNTHLTILGGYVEMMAAQVGLDHPFQKHLQEMDATVTRATHLTRQLLAFSRQQKLKMQPLDIGEAVQSVSQMLSRLIGSQIALKVKIGTAATILADRGQVEQVLINLVANARDAMPRGGLAVVETDVIRVQHALGTRQEVPPGVYSVISVSDTGEGMTEEVQKKIFEPFFTTKAQGKGTGLGLATVFGIIRQHQGFITVQSQLQQGTTFRVFLPVFVAEEKTQNEKDASSRPLELSRGKQVELQT